MNHRQPSLRTQEEVQELRNRVEKEAARTAEWLVGATSSPMELLRTIRFERIGRDPLIGTPLNFVEQLNQSFTILVSLRAVETLLQLHPDAGGFRLALGTCKGRDIESVKPGLVAAETFAATRPESNRKLNKEVARLALDESTYRYVFFASPQYLAGRQVHKEKKVQGIQIFAVDL